MFRINTCLVDAKLTQDLENAILNVAQVEDNQALCPMQANKWFAAAQAGHFSGERLEVGSRRGARAENRFLSGSA